MQNDHQEEIMKSMFSLLLVFAFVAPDSAQNLIDKSKKGAGRVGILTRISMDRQPGSE